MTRVTGYTQFQALNADLIRAQRDLMEGFGLDAGRVVSARAALERASAQADANLRLEGRMDVQDLALARVSDAADQIRAAIGDAIAADSGVDFMSRQNNAFRQAALRRSRGDVRGGDGRLLLAGVAFAGIAVGRGGR